MDYDQSQPQKRLQTIWITNWGWATVSIQRKSRFTQYMPSKPARYGIKVFCVCDSTNGYPLQGEIYTGKPAGGGHQVNVGEFIVLDLCAPYKGSGINVTTDNFFTSLQLAQILNSWNLTLARTVQRNKAFLPKSIQPDKAKSINSTNITFSKEATLYSYVPNTRQLFYFPPCIWSQL